MSLSLSNFDPSTKLPPSLLISGIVMDYLDEEPPLYRSIREFISKFFTTKDTLPGPKPDYFIFFQSRHVSDSDPRQADVILLAEGHDDILSKQWNSKLVDTVVKRESIFLAEGLQYKENDEECTKAVREGLFKRHQISKYAQTRLSLYGWDDNDGLRELFEAEAENRKPVHVPPVDANGKMTWVGCKVMVQGFKDPSLHPLEKLLFMEAIEKYIADGFCTRTPSMINSIKQAISICRNKNLKGKIFVLAGAEHLSQQALYEPKMSLTLLYQYLKTVSAIVLCPTVIGKILETNTQSPSTKVKAMFTTLGISIP